jgi:hypothetical protein
MGNRGFNVESVLLCDDIRREDNGKAILVGVYSGDIVIPIVPATLGLHLWLQGRAVESAREFGFRAQVLGKTRPATKETSGPTSRSFSVEPGSDFLIAIGKIQVQIPCEGEMSVQVKYGVRPWAEVLKKRIIVAAPGPAFAGQQPS